MKELKGCIREARLGPTVQALQQAGARSVSVVRVVPIGADTTPAFLDISRAVPVAHYQEMVKVELVCPDEQVAAYADIIRDHACSGDRGDGVIFVSSVEDAIHIRTGRRGDDVVR